MIGLLPFPPQTPNETELGRLVRSVGVKSVTASYAVDATDNTIRVDTSAGNVIITLPAAALMQERVTTVKKITADANTVTVTPATGETIDGASSLVLSTQWQSFALQSDGATWSKIWAYDTSTPANLAAEAATRAAADSAEAATRASADSSEATARANADSLLQAKSEKNAASGYAGLDASSKLTGSQQAYGTAANTACEGNDARLSDTRTPTDNTVSTAKLQADAVTYPKIQNVSATDKVLGRSTAGAGDIEEIACTAAGRALIADADAAAQRATLGIGTLGLLNIGDTITSDANALPNMSNNGRSYTIANNGTQDIGPLASGIIVIYDSGTTAGLAIIGINSTTCKVLAETIANVYTITSGTGSRINVFFSGATATGVRIENKLGGSTTVRVLVFRLQ